MSTPALPPASFRWLLDIFSIGISARLIKECRAVAEMITTIAPDFAGKSGLEGMLLMKEQRLQEAVECLSEARSRLPDLTIQTYFLYQCLRETGNPDWIFYAQEVARGDRPEFAAAAREALGTQLSEDDAASAASAAAGPRGMQPPSDGLHRLIRI